MEIKFRGKQVDSGEWYHGFYVKGRYGWHYIISEYNGLATIPHAVEGDTVGMYTGCVDRNGTEIFVGDIVRYWNGTIDEDGNGNIEIDGKRYSRTAEKTTEVVREGASFCLKRHNPIDCFKGEEALTVIGNKYDNPEFLEGDE